jgi:hypothetical protein
VPEGAVGAEVALREDAQGKHMTGVEGQPEDAPSFDVFMAGPWSVPPHHVVQRHPRLGTKPLALPQRAGNQPGSQHVLHRLAKTEVGRQREGRQQLRQSQPRLLVARLHMIMLRAGAWSIESRRSSACGRPVPDSQSHCGIRTRKPVKSGYPGGGQRVLAAAGIGLWPGGS